MMTKNNTNRSNQAKGRTFHQIYILLDTNKESNMDHGCEP